MKTIINPFDDPADPCDSGEHLISQELFSTGVRQAGNLAPSFRGLDQFGVDAADGNTEPNAGSALGGESAM